MRSLANTIHFTHAAAVVVGGVVLLCAALATALNHVAFPAPFVWLDIFVVYFLTALPLAASLVAALWRPRDLPAGYSSLIAVELAALLLVPQLYLHVRTENDIARAIDLAHQSRFGEASELIHRTLSLAPHATLKGQPLSQIATTIDDNVARLEAAVTRPLSADASDTERLERAQSLAMLGQTSQALAMLDSSAALASNADALNLRGTIYETFRQWQGARDSYTRSKTAGQLLADSPEKTAGLVRAITGIAFCERKLGRLQEAEAAWLELLTLAPTADNHFLLAQFYEDTQQTAKSRFHAEQARDLEPKRYRRPANQLLDKLVTSHFGCLGIVQPAESLTR